MESRLLTVDQLQKTEACPGSIKLFEKLFGDSIKVTEQHVLEVYDKFDWNYAALFLLSNQSAYRHLAVLALDKHVLVRSQAWKKFQEQRDSVWNVFRKISQPLFDQYLDIDLRQRKTITLKEYKNETQEAWWTCYYKEESFLSEYEKIAGESRDEYHQTIAVAWAQMYIKEGEIK